MHPFKNNWVRIHVNGQPPGDPPAAPAPPDIPSFDTLAVESTFKVGKKAADHEVITTAIGPAGIVYLGCESDGLSFWDLGSKAMVDGEDDAAVSCTATYINDDRTMLYSGYDACVFRVWELDGSGAPGPIATVATGPTEGVKWLKPDYESNMLYVGVGGAVQVWSLDWELVTTLQGHGYISTIAWADVRLCLCLFVIVCLSLSVCLLSAVCLLSVCACAF